MRYLLPLLLLLTACSPHSRNISSQDFQPWPFTVSEGELRCEKGAVIFDDGLVKWGLNGTAQERGYAKVDPIWRDDPAVKGAKVNLGAVIEAGQELCN